MNIRHLTPLRLAMGLAACVVLSAHAQSPAPSPAPSSAPAYPHLARSLAATCANCHGTNGNAKGDMKPLSAIPAERIIKMVKEFRSGEQPASIMHQISKGYTDEQITLIAQYFAAQKPTH